MDLKHLWLVVLFVTYSLGGSQLNMTLHQVQHLTILKIFKNTSSIGEKFGTICIHQQKKIIEITTFRRESNYANSRHPETVQFSNSIEEDLLRRDFTINAMAYHPSTDTLIDPFNGVNDLNHRLLNCVGNALRTVVRRFT